MFPCIKFPFHPKITMLFNTFLIILVAIVSEWSVASQQLNAVSAINDFPVVKSMGTTIEGASVDNCGNLFAINQTHFMNLADPMAAPLLVKDNTSFFSSSRIARTLGFC